MSLKPKQIVDALRSDSELPEAEFKQLEGAVGKLAEIIGKKHNQPVRFAPFCEIMLALLEHLKKNSSFDDHGGLGETIRDLKPYRGNFDKLLADEGTTEDEAIQDLGLKPELQQLYKRGRLTFGELARRQPRAFLGR